MIRKVQVGVIGGEAAGSTDDHDVEIELADGTLIQRAGDFGKGSPANPMSDEELSEKFRQCAAWGGLDRDRTKAVLDLVWRIEESNDVTELTRLLAQPTGQHERD